MRKALLIPAVIAAPLIFGVNSVKADPITLTTFDYPGQTETLLNGISGNDQIVGSVGAPPFSSVFFTANPQGTITSSWTLPSIDTNPPYGIDNTGRIAGSFFDTTTHSIVNYSRSADGTFVLLPFPSGAEAAAVNSSGNIVFSGSQDLYFTQGNGTYTTVSVPGAGTLVNAVTVTGYDNAGDVVGYAYAGTTFVTSTFSFLRSASGNFTIIDVPGSVYTEALGMNDLGQVVGWYVNGPSTGGAFIWSAAAGFTLVDFPGAEYTILEGISDDNTVVGFYNLPGGNDHGLIGTGAVATPEPRFGVTFAVGLLLALTVCKSRTATRSSAA